MSQRTVGERVLGIDFGPRYRHQCRYCLRPMDHSAGMTIDGRPAHAACYDVVRRNDHHPYSEAMLCDPRYVVGNLIVEVLPAAAAGGALPWDWV